jgi:hypothetical protein
VIEAIRERRRPDSMKADETALYDFATELVNNNSILTLLTNAHSMRSISAAWWNSPDSSATT